MRFNFLKKGRYSFKPINLRQDDELEKHYYQIIAKIRDWFNSIPLLFQDNLILFGSLTTFSKFKQSQLRRKKKGHSDIDLFLRDNTIISKIQGSLRLMEDEWRYADNYIIGRDFLLPPKIFKIIFPKTIGNSYLDVFLELDNYLYQINWNFEDILKIPLLSPVGTFGEGWKRDEIEWINKYDYDLANEILNSINQDGILLNEFFAMES